MKIPKTVSMSPDNDRPSFLTLLPEFRNLIYAVLSNRGTAMFIHNVREYYAQKPVPPQRAEDEDDGVDEGVDPDTETRRSERTTYSARCK